MAVIEQDWKRKEYETWDDAFRGLAPAVRQQSVRVASYTQVLFSQACSVSFGVSSAEGKERMLGKYADLAYKCGLYHQLGKALVPPEYQLWQNDFTEEEQAVYRKYTTDGRLLVATLQERGARAKEKRKGELSELPTRNIPWLMIRESCEQHMERWDGTGYPNGRRGGDISVIAQIVGLAKELDRLSAETKAENPFDDACVALIAGAGTQWAPELIEVLKGAKTKCRAVYKKYIYYTMTLPKTIPLVEKRKERPMGLSYRPMVGDGEGTVVAYEAIPWFGGIADRPGETEPVSELIGMLCRKELVADVALYFAYEAADTMLRAINCQLPLKCVVLQMMPEFYTQGTQLQKLNQLFKDQPIGRQQLIFTIPMQSVLTMTKTNREIVERYLRNGVTLLLDDYRPGEMSVDQVKAMGFTWVRFAPELNLQQETAELMTKLRGDGFTLVGSGADTPDAMLWLAACGMTCFSGTLTGQMVSEDELIRDGLLAEK